MGQDSTEGGAHQESVSLKVSEVPTSPSAGRAAIVAGTAPEPLEVHLIEPSVAGHRRWRTVAIVSAIILVVAGAVVGGVCGSGLCSSNSTTPAAAPASSENSFIPPNDPVTFTPIKLTYAAWKQWYIRDSGHGRLYVATRGDAGGNSTITVSEAIGYGMMIAALAKDEEVFQGLLKFYQHWLNGNGLMSWKIDAEKAGSSSYVLRTSSDGVSGATDGDLDVAYALLLAYEKWNNDTHLMVARDVLSAIKFRCISAPEAPNATMYIGDWVSPQSNWSQLIRSSDFVLEHMDKFAQYDKSGAPLWQELKVNMISILNQVLDLYPGTGLISDFLLWNDTAARFLPVTKMVLERDQDQTFYWNACRVPWRVGVYYAATKDANISSWANVLSSFLKSKPAVTEGFTLSGQTVPSPAIKANAFQAPAALLVSAMLGATNVPDNWKVAVETMQGIYYQDTVALLCLMQMEQFGINW